MIKKLTRHGNSLALVIDRGVLDLLKIDDRTPLDISTDGKVLIIFVDGNKRTGAASAVVFLLMNGIELHADEEGFEAMVRSIAEGNTGKAGGAEFFRKHGTER